MADRVEVQGEPAADPAASPAAPAASASFGDTSATDFMRCAVCTHEFNDVSPHRPLVLPCGHSFCESCVAGLRVELCPLDRQPFSRPQTSVNYSLMEACVFIRQHGLADRRPPDGVVGPPSLQHLADSLLTSAAQLSCRLAHETREFALTRVVPVVQQQGERLRNHLIPVVNQGIDELRARMRRITEPGPAGNPVGNHAAN